MTHFNNFSFLAVDSKSHFKKASLFTLERFLMMVILFCLVIIQTSYAEENSLSQVLPISSELKSTKTLVPKIEDYESTVKPFIAEYCIVCHEGEDADGGMHMDELGDVINDVHQAEKWQEILDTLNGSEMPPKKEPKPSNLELTEFIDVLTRSLHEARDRLTSSTKITVRRLNKREYENTIESLLGVKIKTDSLPEDTKFEDFDTVGQAQTLSVLHFEQYLKLGREAIEMALEQKEFVKPKKTRYEVEVERNAFIDKSETKARASVQEIESGELNVPEDIKEKRLNKAKSLVLGAQTYRSLPGSKDGVIIPVKQLIASAGMESSVFIKIPKGEGLYKVRFRAGLTKPLPTENRYIGVERVDFIPRELQQLKDHRELFRISETIENAKIYECTFNRAIGRETIRLVAFSKQGERRFPNGSAEQIKDSSRIWIDWIELEGPIQPPSSLPGRERIFFQGEPKRGIDENDYASKIIAQFTQKAFRFQGVSQNYLEGLNEMYRAYREDGASFEDSIKETLAVVLASPGFLFMSEPAESSDGGKLSDLELACRLSYLFWSRPPDDQLYAIAKSGNLSNPEVLNEQVNRMIKDPLSEEFVESFTSQWLDLGWYDMLVVNRGKYRNFHEQIRLNFREEPIRFMRELLDHDLSVMNLIDSDFIVANGVLSEFYGLKAHDEPGFQRVSIPKDSPRGGLLGQGAVLTLTSTGERTSPVERGVFVLTKLLGTHPPPPPPNVPQLETSGGKLSIREQLEIHASKAQCGSCHRRFDPLGFALEEFDAIGAWRGMGMDRKSEKRPNNKADKNIVDSVGVMPNGQRIDGHEQLKEYLLENKEKMAKGFMKSLLIYSLGRPVGFGDKAMIDDLHHRWKSKDYGFKTLVHLMIQTEAFRSK